MGTNDPIWGHMGQQFIFCPASLFRNPRYTIMARQESLVKFKGKIGDLSFYKTKDGYLARTKGGPSKEQIKSDPRFLRTRENGSEFGRAANVGKMLREQLRPVLVQGADVTFSNRLTSLMNRVLRADEVNGRGDRQIIASNLGVLTGMECNVRAKLSEVFYAQARPVYDSATAETTLELPEMIAKNQIKALQGATHVQVLLAVTEFDSNRQEVNGLSIVRSSYLDIGRSDPSPAQVLHAQQEDLPQPGTALLVLMGVSYFQFVSGGYYPLANGQYNALTFVQVIQS